MGPSCRVLLVLLVLGTLSATQAASILRLDLGAEASCQPWTVPAAERCGYVTNNSAVCFPDGGIQSYLKIHYCDLGGKWQPLSYCILFVAVALCFGFLLTSAERFFCPSLELISDYLRLSPTVAGATLLSFGNGAPDIFTQLAAAKGGSPGMLGIALSEPLGGGLFTSNVVLGLVVLLSSKRQQVALHTAAFVKDLLFYLAALCLMLLVMMDGKVYLWETALMLALYVLYVLATFVVCRGEPPVHASLHQHELPVEEMLGEVDSCSVCDSEYESPRCKQHNAWISSHLNWGLEQGQDQEVPAAAAAEDDLRQPLLPTTHPAADAAETAAADAAQPWLHSSQHLRQQGEEQALQQQQGQQQQQPDAHVVWLGGGTAGSSRSRPASPAAAATSPQRQQQQQQQAEGSIRLQAGNFTSCCSTDHQHHHHNHNQQCCAATGDPPAAAAAAAALPVLSCCTTGGTPAGVEQPLAAPAQGKGADQSAVQLQVGNGALEAAEGRIQEQQHHHHHGWGWHHWLQRPFVVLLATTMPRVGSSHAHHYPWWRAALLPFTTPAFAVLLLCVKTNSSAPLLELPPQLWVGWLVAGVVLALALHRAYPQDGVPRGRLLGMFACISFCMSVVWLNVAASLLVELCVVLGKVWGLQPALLGATVLAWGNSAPDLVNNVSMGRDGFPVMAITACFASPLFSLLVGMSSALTVGALKQGGVLVVSVTEPLLVMYGFAAFNLVKYLLVVPLLCRSVLGRRFAMLAFAFYGVYSLVYGLVQADVF